MSSVFKFILNNSVQNYSSNDYSDNYDYRRYGNRDFKQIIKQLIFKFKKKLESIGLQTNVVSEYLARYEPQLQWLYEQLRDDESKRLLVDLLAYRILGHRCVKLPLNTPEYWDKLNSLERQLDNSAAIELGFLGWKLDFYDLNKEGYPIRVYARASGIFTQMILQQYRCYADDLVIEAVEGDTVIDGGGCYGDTALYFASKVGSTGRVFSFEFMPENIKVFNKNIALNAQLASCIQLIEQPLWFCSGQKLFVEGIGPAAQVTTKMKSHPSTQVITLSIDDLVKEKNINKIDFIKMDIEGAELKALKGAEMVIRTMRPKLAISVYHDLCDFWTIAQWIDQLGLGYNFYLRHFTIHSEETVLFAAVK